MEGKLLKVLVLSQHALSSCFFSLLLQSLETALKYCNYMFTTVFVLEAVLKLVAFGLRRFFKDR